MVNKEEELSKLVKDVENESFFSPPPLFEVFTAVFSLLMTIVLFLYPDMMMYESTVYNTMSGLMPQSYWAITFFVAALLKAIGLIVGSNIMRIIGLSMSVVIYLVISVSFGMVFPNIAAVVFGVLAVFTAVSIPLVRFTSLRHDDDSVIEKMFTINNKKEK